VKIVATAVLASLVPLLPAHAGALDWENRCGVTSQDRHARLLRLEKRINGAQLDVDAETDELNYELREFTKRKKTFRIADITMVGSGLLLGGAGALTVASTSGAVTLGGLTLVPAAKITTFAGAAIVGGLGIFAFGVPGISTLAVGSYKGIANQLLKPGKAFNVGFSQGNFLAEQFLFSGHEFDPIRNFLRAPDCTSDSCSVDFPNISELLAQIEQSYEKRIEEIEASDPWYLPQYMTRTKIRLISDAEIPRTRARLEVRKAQISYYESLKAFLIEDQEFCGQ
jgi:hypothetical protein